MNELAVSGIRQNEKLTLEPELFRVIGKQRETYDTFTLELAPQDRRRLFAYSAGQFNMLYVFGFGEVPISISGDSADQHTIVHTTRAVGGVTKALQKLSQGDVIGVRGPFGSTWPLEGAKEKDVVVVAGGIGLAPLRPVIYHLLAHRDEFQRIVLLYGARSPEDILFRKELEKWRGKFDVDVHITVDRASPSWKGNVGVVTRLISKAPIEVSNTIAMICGPEIMMRYTIRELDAKGISNDHIYISTERNMKCGVGLCGRCQFGPTFICKDGPVFPYSRIRTIFETEEV